MPKPTNEELLLLVKKLEEDNSNLLKLNKTITETLKSSPQFKIFSIDKDNKYSWFNQAHAQEIKLLFDADIQIGVDVTKYYNSEIHVENFKKLLDKIENGKSIKYVREIKHENGSKHYEVNAIPLLGTAGNYNGAIINSFDITDYKIIEKDLKESQRLLSAVLESSLDHIVSYDLDLRYTSFNETHKRDMKDVYGVNIELGNAVLDYITVKKDRDKLEKLYRRVLCNEQFTIEEKFGKGEDKSWYEKQYSPIHDSMGNVKGISVFASNKTHQKRAEEELEKFSNATFSNSREF